MVQHIEYVPYGEVFIEERNNVWNSPYLFNAKEFDEETGLYYYGARYYDPRLAMWLGVDPLTEKYPNVSPYNYCINNPIRNVDIYGLGPADRVKKARSMIGRPYKNEVDFKLRTEDTEEALEYMDCSEFVCRVFADDGLTEGVKHMNTSAIYEFLKNEKTFEHSDTPTVGDIAVWEGHVGIVSDVDGSKIKLIHARGSNKNSAENSFCIEPSDYRTSIFHGYFHPMNESNEQDDPIIYNGGILSEIIILGEGKSKLTSKITID